MAAEDNRPSKMDLHHELRMASVAQALAANSAACEALVRRAMTYFIEAGNLKSHEANETLSPRDVMMMAMTAYRSDLTSARSQKRRETLVLTPRELQKQLGDIVGAHRAQDILDEMTVFIQDFTTVMRDPSTQIDSKQMPVLERYAEASLAHFLETAKNLILETKLSIKSAIKRRRT